MPSAGESPADADAFDHLVTALRAGGIGVWRWDRRSDAVRWDEGTERLYGIPPGSFGGTLGDWLGLVHPEDRNWVLATIDRALRPDAELVLEHRIVRPDGVVRWVHGKGAAFADAFGEVAGMLGVVLDVTARHEAEEDKARLLVEEQKARMRLEFLAEASSLLAQSLDTSVTLQQLAEMVVPEMADWCAIELVEGGHLAQIAVVHVDPAKVGVALRLRHEYGTSPDEGVGKVLRTGRPEFLPEISDADLRALVCDQRQFELHREVGFRSAMIVPLRARGAVIGALTMVNGDSQRRMGLDDLVLAEDLARRAAIAIDNGRLYEGRSRAVEVLQSSLLPPDLPQVPGAEIGTYHESADDAVDIGGDFYDVFDNRDGTWTVLLGDVCGKGADAAVLNGLARHTVRAAALHDPDPKAVLRTLNEVLLHHGPTEAFCTVTVGGLRPTSEGLALDLATAGHPAPIVLRAGGSAHALGEGGLIVGAFPDLDLVQERVLLAPGDALVLYTDGVTEARRGGRLFGLEGLLGALEGCAGGTAQQIASGLGRAVRAWRDSSLRDDTAVLVVRCAPRGSLQASSGHDD